MWWHPYQYRSPQDGLLEGDMSRVVMDSAEKDRHQNPLIVHYDATKDIRVQKTVVPGQVWVGDQGIIVDCKNLPKQPGKAQFCEFFHAPQVTMDRMQGIWVECKFLCVYPLECPC